MGRKLFLIAAIFCAAQSSQLFAQRGLCEAIDGATVLNDDNEFIGKISSPLDPDSIYNQFGIYGNPFSTDSIWNQFGTNGNPFSTTSAFNQFTVSPPRIIKNRTVIGYLTANKSIAGGVHPTAIGVLCYDFKPPR